MTDLYNYSLQTVFLVGLAVILIATELGRRLGLTVGRRGGDNITTLEASVLGLLALMVGFTFAMALARFDSRRDAVLNEANAIGTTALRARMLPQPQKKEVLNLLREYVKVRLDITQRPVSVDGLKAAIDKSNELQEALWRQAMVAAAKDNAMVPTGLFIQTLNEMIDNQGKRLAALRNRVPDIVVVTLFGVAALACAFSGYASGIEKQRTVFPAYIVALLISAVILLILDLDRPSVGFIEVSQQPMIDTAASIAGFSD
jgi:uncharacterized membrane protein YidH (DUF202 family)